MSWASRRKAVYIGGILVFFGIIIGVPVAYKILSIKPTCFDGKQDGGETAIDEGGPCLKMDPRSLQPSTILWARSFLVRTQAEAGSNEYTAVAYIQNPNEGAGVPEVHYSFMFYDSQNTFVGERDGETPIMPGGVTPVFETDITTGYREIAHTYFQFTDPTLDWEHMTNPTAPITVNDQQESALTTAPRITAIAQNTSYGDLTNTSFVAVVFDTAGNAFAASETNLPDMEPNAQINPAYPNLVFTWPDPFAETIGHVDIIPLHAPIPQEPGSAQ